MRMKLITKINKFFKNIAFYADNSHYKTDSIPESSLIDLRKLMSVFITVMINKKEHSSCEEPKLSYA